jgi:hypothetical protein
VLEGIIRPCCQPDTQLILFQLVPR